MNEGRLHGDFRRLAMFNYKAEEVAEIIGICDRNGYAKPSVFEGHYNLMLRGGERELFPLPREHGVAFVPYRSVNARRNTRPELIILNPAAGGLFSENAPSSSRWSPEASTQGTELTSSPL